MGVSSITGLPLIESSNAAVGLSWPAGLTVTVKATPTKVKQGSTISVRVTMKNPGDIDLWYPTAAYPPAPAPPNLVLPGPFTPPVTSPLGGGKSRSFTVTYTALTPGYVDFTATVTGQDSILQSMLLTAGTSGTVNITPGAWLSSAISATPGVVRGGQSFTVTLTVTNVGAAAVNDLVPSLAISDPSIVRVDSYPPSAGITLGGGASHNFIWQLTATGRDSATLYLTAGAAGTDSTDGAGLSVTGQAAVLIKPKPDGMIAAYPNPVNGDRMNIYLRLTGAAREVTVDAYDSGMHRVFGGKWGYVDWADGVLEVDGMRKWAPGIYILRARAVLADGTEQKFPLAKVAIKR
jgi:hypothetical protein